jgi:hypothetical protein
MTKEQLNEQFKTFFKNRGFKVRKDYDGMKATKEDVALTFYIGYDMFAKCYKEETGLDSKLWVKLPYTDYVVANYEFNLETVSGLNTVFADHEFLKLFDFKLPKINKTFN